MKISNGKLAALIMVLVIVIDQAVKIWVKTHFYYGEEVMVTSWFRLLFIENNGMAFGMELGSKLLLTLFRIIASGAIIYYLWRLRRSTDVPKGYVACIALIAAGALGNVIDCIAYGLIFDHPMPPQVAQLFPPDGGYASLFSPKWHSCFPLTAAMPPCSTAGSWTCSTSRCVSGTGPNGCP